MMTFCKSNVTTFGFLLCIILSVVFSYISVMLFEPPPAPIDIRYKLGEPPVVNERGSTVNINEPGNYDIDNGYGKCQFLVAC